MAKNINMNKAKKEKNDEFYTQYEDIERELAHYMDHFKDKIVFCNCDDPEWSNFWKYFENDFNILGLKKLISTHYEENDPSYKLELECIDGQMVKTKTPLKGNGDFRNQECVDILKECDIVVTNPPFSLFREYVSQLIDYNKKFLIIGNMNAISYKEFFPYILSNNIWLGINNGTKFFRIPDHYELSDRGKIENGQKFVPLGDTTWFTNLEHKKRHQKMILFRTYEGNENIYKKYDNYDAINVDKCSEIPYDFYEKIGVPISFLNVYCPEQFEILGIDRYMKDNPIYGKRFTIDGKEKYARLLIKRIDLDDKEFYGLD